MANNEHKIEIKLTIDQKEVEAAAEQIRDASLTAAQREIDEQKKKIGQLEREIDERNATVSKLMQEKAGIRRTLSDIKSERDDLADKLGKLAEELREVRRRNGTMDSENHSLRSNKEKLRGLLKNQRHTIMAQIQEIEELQGQLRDKVDQQKTPVTVKHNCGGCCREREFSETDSHPDE